MTVELSKEEYRDLLDILYMGQWVLDSHDTERDPSKQKHDEVIQKFYAQAQANGFELLMEYDEQLKEHFPTRLFEDASMAREYIDEYDDQTFWDELINRLTDRDIEMMLKRGEIQKPQNREERFAIRGPIERRYAQEFERNGLDNVVVNIDQQINEAN